MTLLITWLWQGLALAGAASLFVRLISPLSAARRHGVWWFTLLAVLSLPLLRVAQWGASSGTLAASPLAGGLSGSGAPAVDPLFHVGPLPPWVLPVVVGAWLLCVLAASARTWAAWRAMRALVERAEPHPACLDRLTALPGAASLLSRRPEVRVSEEIRGACAVGFRRPVVLMSAALLRELDEDRLQQVLLHECAHLARRDDWTRLALRVLTSAAIGHPAVHLIARRIEHEMEAACDQRVVASMGDPARYAHALLDVAAVAQRHGGVGLALAPGTSASMPLLRSRIERLAAAARGQHGRWSRLAAACASGAVVCLTAAGGSLPVVVAFGSAYFTLPDVARAVPALRTVADLTPVRGEVHAGAGAQSVAARPDPAPRDSATSATASEPQDSAAAPAVVGAVPGLEPFRADADARADAADAPLEGRPLPVNWQTVSIGRPADATMSRGDAVKQSAARVTRAAQSTAGAFTRFSHAVASRF